MSLWPGTKIVKSTGNGFTPPAVSVFGDDPQFTRGAKITVTSEKAALDLGVLSPSGEKGYLQRVAVRKNNLTISKSEPGRIPNALRSSRSK